MKKLLSLFTALLLCAATVLLSSCASAKKYQQKVLDYLAKNYESKKFELTSYTTNKGTSSRYEVKARCIDDGTDFDIYVYSAAFITDSYSVTRANKRMESLIHPIVSGTDAYSYIGNIRWLRPYNEETTDYSFRSVSNPEAVVISELTSIDTVTFVSEVDTTEEAANGITAFIDAFAASDISLESVTFEFSLTYAPDCRLTTNSESIKNSEKSEIIQFIESQIASNTEAETKIWSFSQKSNSMTFDKTVETTN